MNKQTQLYPWREALMCLLAFYAYRYFVSIHADPIFLYVTGGLAAGYGIVTAWKLGSVFRWLYLVFGAAKPSGIYGSAIKPTAKDAKAFGLQFEDPNKDGFLIAAKDGKLLFYTGNSHVTCVASNGAGKSASSAIPIGLSLGAHRSLVFTGKGLEVAKAITRFRREELEQPVYINNPWDMEDYPSHCINPLGDLHKFVAKENPEALDIAESKALLLIPETKGENKYFSDAARAYLSKFMVYGVWREVDTGELCGNLPWLFKRVCGSEKELRRFLLDMSMCDAYAGSISDVAERFLTQLNQSPKTAMSVLGAIINALTIFDPASKLGQNIVHSDFDVEQIKQYPVSIGICIPADKVATHGVYAGLVIDMLIGICLRAQKFEPRCTFLLDEFANLSKGEIPSVIPALYVGRSMGCQLVTYSQDTATFERYSEKSAFVTQAEVYMAWSIRSTKDAEEYSKRSGNYTATVESTNLPQDMGGGDNGQYSVSLSEKSVPLYRPDEFMQMKDYTAALFFKQNPPIMSDLVHYQSVKQWRAYAENFGELPIDHVPVGYAINA